MRLIKDTISMRLSSLAGDARINSNDIILRASERPVRHRNVREGFNRTRGIIHWQMEYGTAL